MVYNKNEFGKITKLTRKNVDNGMGVERTTAILEGVTDNYMSSLWKEVITLICDLSNKEYIGNEKSIKI